MKKAVILLLVIIIILVIVLALKITNNNSEDSNKYTRTDAITLIKKGENYNNYYCENTNFEQKIIRKIKDNKMVVVNDHLTIYIDYNSNKRTILKNTENIAIVSSLDSSKFTNIDKNYFQECIDVLNDFENYEYKFIKEEKINEFDCIKIALTSKSIESIYDYEIWIDISSGLVTKTILYNNEMNSNMTKEYNLKLNSITDEEVTTPDLSNYNVTKVQ